MSTTRDIPEDIRKKIVSKAQTTYGDLTVYSHAEQGKFIAGAEFGYSLSLQKLAAQEARIKELEGEIKDHEENTLAYDNRVNELVKGLTGLLKTFEATTTAADKKNAIQDGWNLVNEVEEKKAKL